MRRRWTVPLAAAAASAALVVPLHPAAAAPGPQGAAARAEQLRAQVAALQQQAEVATEHYDAAEARLGAVVTRRLLAQEQVDAARALADGHRSTLDDRVRALYMSGGQLGLVATVLDAPDLSDAIARLRSVRSVVAADHRSIRVADAALGRARAAEAQLAALSRERTRLEVQAAGEAGRVRDLLSRTQTLLADADAQVRALAAAAAADAQRRSAAAFAARLAAAQVGAGADLAPSAVAAVALAAARTRLGDPYVWGAAGPDSFDCSGLVQWSYAQAGLALPRVAADQWNSGPHPDLAQLAPGDLLFWATDPADPATIHHVALYLGGGSMLAAPHTGDVVRVQPVYGDGFVGATRPTEPAETLSLSANTTMGDRMLP